MLDQLEGLAENSPNQWPNESRGLSRRGQAQRQQQNGLKARFQPLSFVMQCESQDYRKLSLYHLHQNRMKEVMKEKD